MFAQNLGFPFDRAINSLATLEAGRTRAKIMRTSGAHVREGLSAESIPFLMAHPALGVVSLTLVLASLFLVEGIFDVALFFQMRNWRVRLDSS